MRIEFTHNIGCIFHHAFPSYRMLLVVRNRVINVIELIIVGYGRVDAIHERSWLGMRASRRAITRPTSRALDDNMEDNNNLASVCHAHLEPRRASHRTRTAMGDSIQTHCIYAVHYNRSERSLFLDYNQRYDIIRGWCCRSTWSIWQLWVHSRSDHAQVRSAFLGRPSFC